ncbi:hypothetical protein GNP80_13620 [Aliivibrio fischeri]|uniref:hypothetical protein n=1 Tax=Aliivibrio fischeri TaxID=668 RepID=UPI0012DABAE7|nr:hypothetical protein [Aliivibrio fischeri]MUK93471.1 hypothetical protein [Aliivibrio fischeri]
MKTSHQIACFIFVFLFYILVFAICVGPEISSDAYSQVLELASNPVIRPRIEIAMIDGEISIFEYLSIRFTDVDTTSPKSELITFLQDGK